MRKLFVFIILSLGIIVLQGCRSIDYSATQIRYDGTILSWENSQIRNASYTVIIDQDERLSNSSQTSFNIGQMHHSFTVELVIREGGEEKARLEKTFTYLEPVSEVQLNETGELVWSAVAQATQYRVRINNQDVMFSSPRYTNPFPVGLHSVIITPVGPNESFFSYASQPFDVRKLSTVQNITYQDDVIRWDNVPFARIYEVYINNQLYATTNERHVNYHAENQSFDIRIRALGDERSLVLNSDLTPSLLMLYLDTPTNLRMESGVLVWDAVSDASGYEITVNGVLSRITENRYENLEAGVVSDVRIKAVSNQHQYFSNASPSQTFSILRAPSIDWNASLTVETEINQNILWDTVLNAQGYRVELTKPSGEVEIFNFGASQRVFGHAYDQAGTYTVRVQALSDPSQTDVSSSRFSNTITIHRLNAPTIGSQAVTSHQSDLAQGFSLQFNSVQFASGYQLFKEGDLLQESSSNTFNVRGLEENSTLEEQELTFKLISTGSVRTVNGQKEVVLNSLMSEATSFTITILATPQRIEFSGFMAQWEPVRSATGYTVRVGATTFTSTQSEHNFDSVEPGSYSFSVIARGDGRFTLPSNASAGRAIQRLEPPTNLRIGTQDVNEGTLTFDPVVHALSYQVIIGHNETPIDFTGLGSILNRISTNGTPVMVIAVANYLEAQTGVYLITSPASPTKQFTRLAPPTFAERPLSNTSFSWLAPNNIQNTEYTPLYRVYNHNKLIYNTGVTGRTMTFEAFEPGSYTFYVRAIGDGINFINSDYSAPLEMRILPPVDIQIVDNAYQWQALSGATSYEVFIDGQQVKVEPHVAGQTYRFTPNFTELKTYTVEIIARGNNGVSVVDSKPSVIQQLTRRLSTPAFTFAYSHDAVTPGGTINIDVTSPAPHSLGNIFVIGGATHTSSENSYQFSPGGPGDYILSVTARGGAIVDGIYYLNSLSAGGTATTTLSLLGAPTLSEVHLSHDGRLRWGPDASANRFEYDIVFNDGTTMQGTTTRTFLDLDLVGKTSVTVRLRAYGTGHVISSEWITYTRNLD